MESTSSKHETSSESTEWQQKRIIHERLLSSYDEQISQHDRVLNNKVKMDGSSFLSPLFMYQSDKTRAFGMTNQSQANMAATIVRSRAELEAQPEGPERLDTVKWLAAVYGSQHALSGDIEDLETGILFGKEAVGYLMDESEHADALFSLGMLYKERYDVTEYLPDLQQSISFLNRFVSAHADRDVPWAMGNWLLGTSLYVQYTVTRLQTDLEAAIATVRQAMATTPTDLSDYYQGMLRNMVLMLREPLAPDDGDDHDVENDEEGESVDIWKEVMKEVSKRVPFIEDQYEKQFQTVNLEETARSIFQAPGVERDDLAGPKPSLEDTFVLERRGDPVGPRNQNQIRFKESGFAIFLKVPDQHGSSTIESYSMQNAEQLKKVIQAHGLDEVKWRETGHVDREVVELQDVWRDIVDNDFALEFFRRSTGALRAVAHLPDPGLLCQRCRDMTALSPRFETTFDCGPSEARCELCALLTDQIQAAKLTTPIRIFRAGSSFMAEGRDRPILTICATPGTQSSIPASPADLTVPADVQVGYPILPEPGSPTQAELLRQYLHICDMQHECRHGEDSALPTRVIDVGDGSYLEDLHLHVTNEGDRGKYLTLSHSWGKLEQIVLDKYLTYNCNLREKCRGIVWADLPRTFQDAVTITRQLGMRFLWIDSICIIQRHKGCSAVCDSLSDWDKEAGKMGRYYNWSYATLAATAATDSKAGFLHPRKKPRQCVNIRRSPSGSDIYVCEPIDDFQTDVVDAALNTRGWVLQERALSRRIIHFTANQVYWECASAIRCGTMTKLTNQKAAFLSDPQFPECLGWYTKSNRVRLFQHLFTTYSTCALTYATDRPAAISGLLERMSEVLGTKTQYGIIDRFLHRSLIWRSSGKSGDLKRLAFGNKRKKQVPSWSWLAYDGAIEYVKIPFYERVEWSESIEYVAGSTDEESKQGCNNDDVDAMLKAFAREFSPNMNVEAQAGMIFDGVGKTKFDLQRLRCVILGRVPAPKEAKDDGPDVSPAEDVEMLEAPAEETNHEDKFIEARPGSVDAITEGTFDEQEHFVLLVMPAEGKGDHMYERVGIASIHRKHIQFERPSEEIFII